MSSGHAGSDRHRTIAVFAISRGSPKFAHFASKAILDPT
jgi:hypothetical protein